MHKFKWGENIRGIVAGLDKAEIRLQLEDLNGNALIYDELICSTAQKYGGYLLIQADLNSTLSILKLSLKLKEVSGRGEEVTEHALFLSSLITYGKCYSDSNSRKCSLEKNDVFKENPELLVIHENLIDLRNNYVAHAGFNLNEKFHIYAVRDSHSDHYSIIKGITSSQINDLDDNLLAFEKVVNFNKIKIEQKLTKLHGKLVRKCYRYTYPPTTSLSSV